MSLLVGCRAGAFYVRVNDSHHRAISGASVSVFRDDARDTCTDSRGVAKLTGATGRTLVQLRFCDDVLMTVVASGYQIHREVTDACEDGERVVVLESLPPEPRDEAAVFAREFFLAVRLGEIAQIEAMVADDVAAEHFLNLEHDLYFSEFELRVLRVDPNGTVDLAMSCENGCYTTWTVHLTRQADGWKARDLTPTAAADVRATAR